TVAAQEVQTVPTVAVQTAQTVQNVAGQTVQTVQNVAGQTVQNTQSIATSTTLPPVDTPDQGRIDLQPPSAVSALLTQTYTFTDLAVPLPNDFPIAGGNFTAGSVHFTTLSAVPDL